MLTRSSNRPAVEQGLATLALAENLHFLYYDLPGWAGWWQKGRRGVHLYYLLWQWGVFGVAKKAHAVHRFEHIHHVTFVSARQPSFLGSLGPPFVFGPVSGGEHAPFRLRFGFGLRSWVEELLRDFLNALARFDPFLRRTYHQSHRIYVTSSESRCFVPKRDLPRTAVALAIGIDDSAFEEAPRSPPPKEDGLRLLYVGRFLDWKGMHLGFPALAALASANPKARLTLIGEGPDKAHWQRMAERLGLTGKVAWHGWTAREKLDAVYADHDLFFFSSLRDSGGLVVLEAMAKGLPVVCLDRGGPGVIVNETCGRAVPTEGRDRNAVIEGLGKALLDLDRDPALRSRLSLGAKERVRAFAWKEKVARILAEVESR